MKSPDRFGQLQGEIVPMERYENPLLKPIALSGNTVTPEAPPASPRLTNFLDRLHTEFHHSGPFVQDLDTVQAEVLLLMQQNHHTTQTPQEQNALEILSLNILELQNYRTTELKILKVRTETKQTEYPTH